MAWHRSLITARRQRRRREPARIAAEALEDRALLAVNTITSLGVAFSETFDAMGSAVTATLPSGFRMGADYATGVGATTAAAGTSGTGVVSSSSGGGFYNWANGVTASATDRAIGFLTSGSYSSPRSIICGFTNNTGATIDSLTVGWNYEKYRSGTRGIDWTFFHGGTSTATTAASDGNQSYAADANTTTVSNPPGSTAKSVTLAGLGLAAGSTYYLRWTYTGNGGATNAQGLGIDDVSITAFGAPVATPTISGAATAAAFTTTYGTASAAQTFPVSGSNLVGGLTATAPAGFEVSSDGTSYGATATFVPASGSAAGTLWLRLTATAAADAAYDAQATVLSSPGAASVSIVTAATGNAVARASQTITFAELPQKAVGQPPFSLVASASSGLAVSFASSNPSVATVSGTTVTIVGAGTTSISASQPGNGNYLAASDIVRTLTVIPGTSTVLLAEDFAALTSGDNTTTGGSSTAWTGSSNWPTVLRAYQAGAAVKLGTSSLAGSITSRALDLSGNGGAFTVMFDVKGWTTVEGDITVTVTGLAPQSVTYSATQAAAFETKTLQFTGGQANSTITFATTAKRAFLDSISIVAGGSSTVVVPSAPTIAGITSGNGQLSVAFTPPVSNGGATITGYEYTLDGGVNWLTPSPAVTTSPLVITGLVNGQAYSVRLRALNSAGAGDPSAAVSGTPRATDYLRIVSYNITAADIATPRTGFETLMQAMSAESYNGHVDRVDLLAMQEVQSQATTSASLVARLNAIYGAGAYAHGVLDGATTGNGTQGVVYNTAALQLLEETIVGTVSATGAPRQTLRYKFQPAGGDASSIFYVYNSHLKAADDSVSAARRAADVQVIRADADALGAGTSIIYVGDFNLQGSSEAAYQSYLAAGNGQAFDPINRPGSWSGNRSFLDIFTQAPSANPPTGFATGGLDDRYDFQLVTGSVMSGGGLTYKTGSYRTFGNNGSVPLNGSLNDPTSTALPGLANRTQVLDLLTTVADHLPVVADYAFLSGGQVATPAITVSPGTLPAALTTTAGTASTAQSFSVSGSALTGSLTVTAPTGLEVSLAAASGYATTVSLAPTGGVLAATTVYVRLAATAAAGSYDALAINVSGGGATTQTVLTAANGNTVSPASGTTLFSEDFASLTSGNNTSTSGSSTVWSGSANWSAVSTAYQAGGAVRLGSSSSPGSITTKTLDLTGNGGAFTVSFDVKGWSTVEGDITVTVTGLAPQTVSYAATLASAFETKTLQFTGGQANSTITFATTAKRAFLDTIVVSGGTPTPPVLASIAGFAWNDANGNGTWDKPAESGASGWTVYLDLNRDGAATAGEPSTLTASDGSYSFSGLAAGTYTVALVSQAGWQQTSPSTAAAAQARSTASYSAPIVVAADPAYAPVDRQQQKRFVPNDPLFSQQWHLQNTGQQAGTSGEDARVTTAWDSVKGTGVVIGVVDDGLQYTHPDLAPAYRADLSYDFNGNDADPLPSTGDDHGTAAAGVAAARGNNGIGVSGAAPGASLAGIRLISAVTTDQQEANGLTYKPQDIDIYSNSWGPNDDGATLEGPGSLTRAAMGNAVQTGRGGLGSIYVWAAGNGLDANDNSNYDGYANSRYTIAVAAVDNSGKQSWYSEPGANILVTAPSSGGTTTTAGAGITTTDRTGADGYNVSASASPGNLSDRNYTNDFGGTSSATPLVSGVVALMLEANPNLSWRDVQHVLANSARRNDPTDAGWSQNGAGTWVNHKYGFGVVDATAAVNLAKTWTNVGAEVSATSGVITVGQAIPDNNLTGITSSFTMGADIRVESVEIVFSATHASRGNLQVVLTSPSGTQSVLAEKHADTGDNYSGWTFSTVRDRGESSRGTWTLTVSDRTAGTSGTFGSWAMNVYGTAMPALPGTQAITVAAGQAVADVNFGVQSSLPITPLQVTGAYAKGSAWSAAYLGLPVFTTVGSDALGWPLADGVNQLANASSLTWSNVDTISLQFNQPISQPAATALSLVLGSSLGDQAITPSAAPTLLAGGTIAQWMVPTLDSGKYVISVNSSGISNTAGTATLDGEWTTGTSTFAQGSGDGTAGGMFNFFFNVLLADVNGSGVVNNTDTSAVRNQLFAAVSADNFRNDFNGSNSINNTDVTALRNKLFGALASYQSPPAPVAVPPSITAPTATAVGATNATLGGTVTNDGGEPVLGRGVVLAVTGTNADPVIGGTGTTTISATGSTGLFNVLASGLLSGTNYSFKAYVRTSKGVTYTAVGTFTTA